MGQHQHTNEHTALCFRNGQWLTAVTYSILLTNRLVRNGPDGVTIVPSWTGLIRFAARDSVAETIWRAPAGLELLLADGRHVACEVLQREVDPRQWLVRLTPLSYIEHGIDDDHPADERILAYLMVGRSVLVTDAEYLAYVTALSTREVKSALRRLEAGGRIRAGGNGHWAGNSYWTVVADPVRRPA